MSGEIPDVISSLGNNESQLIADYKGCKSATDFSKTCLPVYDDMGIYKGRAVTKKPNSIFADTGQEY